MTGPPGDGPDLLEGLARTAEVLTGKPLSQEARAQFHRYLDLLLLWSRSQRLTGFESPGEIVRGLFEDSLLFLPLLPGRRPLRIVDIGAGAGFPGVPIRIVDPGLSLTLIEARRKRVSFLKAVGRELGFGASLTVIEGRAEAVVLDLEASFDVAVARAVGAIGQIAPIALGFLKPGGIFIASGPPADPGQERRAAADVVWEVRDYPALGLKRGFLKTSRKS